MSKATATHTTFRRSPEDAATIGLMLLKASIKGLGDSAAPAISSPRQPTLVGGCARTLELA